jgi:phage FluMu gp28-like protein
MPEIFEQEYELKPVGGLASIVPWSVIASSRSEYDIERAHFSQDLVEKLFGEPGANDGRRKALVEKHLLAVMPELFKTEGSNRWRVGFDVAASRQGHLGAMWVSEKIGDTLKLRALVTTQTEDWDVIEWLLETIFSKIPGEVYGSGDETGLGRQICWRMAKLFHGRFFPVNFSSKKSDMGTDLMGRLSSGEIEIPKEHPDIAQDLFAIRKGYKGSKAVFTESRNPANDQSHADMAWACALSCDADSQAVGEYWAMTA